MIPSNTVRPNCWMLFHFLKFSLCTSFDHVSAIFWDKDQLDHRNFLTSVLQPPVSAIHALLGGSVLLSRGYAVQRGKDQLWVNCSIVAIQDKHFQWWWSHFDFPTETGGILSWGMRGSSSLRRLCHIRDKYNDSLVRWENWMKGLTWVFSLATDVIHGFVYCNFFDSYCVRVHVLQWGER